MKKIVVTGFIQEKSMSEMLAERSAAVRSIPLRSGERQCPCYAVDFPVHGGWGYSQDDACVIRIDQTPYDFDRRLRRDYLDDAAIRFEKLFFERRVYEELIFHRLPETPLLECLRWKMTRQSLVRNADRDQYFDRLEFEVMGFLHDDIEMLRSDERACYLRQDREGLQRNRQMAEELVHVYESTCWFDISETFNS